MQEIYFADDMEGLEYKGEWVTDASFAKLIEQRFEDSVSSGVPDFTYAVTIQNHMSYTEDKYGDYACPKVETTVELSPEVQTAVDVYAEGIRDANAMLKELTEFYSAQSEPVLLVFFGDHLPYLCDNRAATVNWGLLRLTYQGRRTHLRPIPRHISSGATRPGRSFWTSTGQ